VLRIEDTDRERSRQEFVDAIAAGMAWLGLDADEGPYFQSARGELYERRVGELIAGGHAYHCFCTPEDVEAKRQQARKDGRNPVYDRTCRDLGHTAADGEAHVVRLRAPLDGETVINDLVRGPVTFDHRELDDLVLVRSDGSPTFHLVVVVDDIDMGITHILRGEDHLSNTPKQAQIFAALGAEPPRYGHLPLIVGQDRSRLSKRHGATALDAYREQGFLPDAVVNYLARLGWSHGDQEIFSREELEQLFDVGGVGKAAGAFDMEKFTWVNFEHMRGMDDAALADAVVPYLPDGQRESLDGRVLTLAVGLLKERAKTLVELAASCHYFISDDIRYDPKAAGKFLGDAELERLDAVVGALDGLEAWGHEPIEAAFRGVIEQLDIKLGKLAQPTRVAITGSTVSPGIFEVCEVLGKERTVGRLRRVCEQARAGSLPLATSDAA